MTRRILAVVLSIVLVAGLSVMTGCSEKPKPGVDVTGSGKADIADERIIGKWRGETETDTVEFRADGSVVMADGSQITFTMDSKGAIELVFPDGSAAFAIEFDGDDKHGVKPAQAEDAEFTWYERVTSK